MESTQYIVAIEIGSSKIVGAIAEKSPSGYVQVIHLEEEKFLDCVRWGCIQNVESTKGCINNILKKLENRIDGTIKDAYVGVSGRSVHTEAAEVSRNLDSTRAITDDILDKIVKDSARETIRNYEIIETVPCAYYVDKNETKNPSGQFGSSINIKVNHIVAKPTIKLNLERVMSLGTRVKNYLVTPLVVGEEILNDTELSLGCMLVDIGAETTTVSIYKDGALIYLITLPLGGRNITRDIVNGLSVLEETAERVKKNINNPLDDNVELLNIEDVKSTDAANYIKARTGEIIANINQQIAYAGLTAGDLHKIVLIGGGAQLQGIARRIEDTTKIKVRMGSYPQSLNILDHSINRMEYIQIFSLLAKGAQIIPENQSCVQRHNYEDGPTMTSQPERPERPAQPEKPAEPVDEDDDKKKKKNRGFLWRMRDRMSSLLDENDEA